MSEIAAAPDFTIAGYESLLATLAGRGYGFAAFDGLRPGARQIVLRHDIDMSLEAARAMARLEAVRGIAATYFVLLRTELYNPLSGGGLAALEEIATLGHRIGLHFDAALYAGERAVLDAAAAREAALLETALGRSVDIISLHRPARALVGDAAPLAGRAHTYQPRFVSEIGYCSDSRGAWHHGHPLDHPSVRSGMALHLLVHPIWWMNKDSIAPEETLRRWLGSRFDEIELALSANSTVHTSPRRPTKDAEVSNLAGSKRS